MRCCRAWPRRNWRSTATSSAKKRFSLTTSRGRFCLRRVRHGFGLRMHADQLSLSGGAQLAAELGTATADHLEHTDAAGIAALKSAGVQPVLLPGSVYALGSSRYPAAREMIDAGLAVVLATDFNPGSSPTPSMPMILSLAVDAYENDAGGINHRGNNQRGLHAQSRRSDWFTRTRQNCRLRYSRLQKITATSRIFLASNTRGRFSQPVVQCFGRW